MSIPNVTAPQLAGRLAEIVGAAHVSTDPDVLDANGRDGTRWFRQPDIVVAPASTAEVAGIARLCSETGTPMVARGAGTGYSGGAIPVQGGVVLSLRRLDRIIDIDVDNLVADVEPGVITGDFQRACEAVGLYYPPDPASLGECTLGGNVAENAGGPRAVKYGVTRDYVLGLEAVLPSGDVIRTGGRTVKNVVGYDLTQLLVGSEGTLAIVTRITVRLVVRPPSVRTLLASFADVKQAARAVAGFVGAHVVPATIEIVDGATLELVAGALGDAALAPRGTGALLLIEVDGRADAVEGDAAIVDAACRAAGATEVRAAASIEAREALWRARRAISPALKTMGRRKFNHDVVVPRARVPECFELIARLEREFLLPIPSFGHAGDGNIHVNIMALPTHQDELARAERAVAALLRGVVALGGSISGEHGIGLSKAGYIDLEVSPETLDAMRRVKRAFDPLNLLNPGKMFPESLRDGSQHGLRQGDSL